MEFLGFFSLCLTVPRCLRLAVAREAHAFGAVDCIPGLTLQHLTQACIRITAPSSWPQASLQGWIGDQNEYRGNSRPFLSSLKTKQTLFSPRASGGISLGDSAATCSPQWEGVSVRWSPQRKGSRWWSQVWSSGSRTTPVYETLRFHVLLAYRGWWFAITWN